MAELTITVEMESLFDGEFTMECGYSHDMGEPENGVAESFDIFPTRFVIGDLDISEGLLFDFLSEKISQNQKIVDEVYETLNNEARDMEDWA